MTLSLDPVDVDLLDRLAELEGSNRSAELRGMLAELRPMLRQIVETLETAVRTKEEFAALAGPTALGEFEELMPEVEKLQNVFLGALARLEGAAAVREARRADPRPSNHGGQVPPTREDGSGDE